jgi:MFS transporter, ACS family, hexuronate transporter
MCLYGDAVRSQSAALLAVALPSFVYGIYRFSIGVVVPQIEGAYSINDSAMGAIISVSVGVVGIGVFLSGNLADRYGPGSTLLSGLVVFLAPLVAISTRVGLDAFTGLFLLSSFGSGLMIPPSFSIVAAILPKRRGIGAGLVSSAYNVGGLVGPAAVGYLLLYYDWQSWFLVVAMIAVVTFTVFFFVLRETTRRGSVVPPRGNLRSLIRDRKVQVLALGAMLADAGFVTYLTWTPKFLLTGFRVSGGSAAFADLIFGVGFGLGGLGIFVAGYLFERIGARKTVFLGGMAASAATTGLYLSGSIAFSLALVLIGSFFLNWFWPLLTVMAQVSVSEDKMASSISLVQTIAFVGAFIGPGLAGLLGGAVSLPLLITVALPYLAYTLVMAFLFRE